MLETTELYKRIIQKDIEGINQLLDNFEENDLINELIYYFVHSDILYDVIETKDLHFIRPLAEVDFWIINHRCQAR